MALSTWHEYFLADVIGQLVDTSMHLVERCRNGELVNLQLVASVVQCLCKASNVLYHRHSRRHHYTTLFIKLAGYKNRNHLNNIYKMV